LQKKLPTASLRVWILDNKIAILSNLKLCERNVVISVIWLSQPRQNLFFFNILLQIFFCFLYYHFFLWYIVEFSQVYAFFVCDTSDPEIFLFTLFSFSWKFLLWEQKLNATTWTGHKFCLKRLNRKCNLSVLCLSLLVFYGFECHIKRTTKVSEHI
jgi:hypothetical protein